MIHQHVHTHQDNAGQRLLQNSGSCQVPTKDFWFEAQLGVFDLLRSHALALHVTRDTLPPTLQQHLLGTNILQLEAIQKAVVYVANPCSAKVP